MDMYLTFKNEAEAKSVLYKDQEQAKYTNIDTIGVISKRTGGTDEEPIMSPIPGWHVNVRVVEGEDADALKPFEVEVKTPMRVWG